MNFGALAFLLLASQATAQICNEDARLVVPGSKAFDGFGSSIGAQGERVVVGAPGRDDLGSGSGAALVFERSTTGAWPLAATLLMNGGLPGDQAGVSVDIDGDHIIVGVPGDDGQGNNAGMAQVFERQPDGTWVFAVELVSSTPAAGDGFGFAVAISGDYAIVGAPFADDLGINGGAAFVFERAANGTWSNAAKFVAPLGSGDFALAGWAVDIDGTRAVIGVPQDDSGGPDVGVVLVCERDSNGVWSIASQAYPAGLTNLARFAFDVAVDGDCIVAGVAGPVGPPVVGEVRVLERASSGTWIDGATLVAPSTTAGDKFGLRVAICGDFVLAGANDNSAKSYLGGAAHLFERTATGTWRHSVTLHDSESEEMDSLGAALALTQDTLFVGAPNEGFTTHGVAAGAVLRAARGALFHGAPRVALSAPKPHNLYLRAGPSWANALYFIGGSASGTTPGLPLGAITVPLVYDAYTELTLLLAAPITSPTGALDVDGRAFARFVAPAGLAPSLAGIELHHAFVAIDPTTFEVVASNPVAVQLVP